MKRRAHARLPRRYEQSAMLVTQNVTAGLMQACCLRGGGYQTRTEDRANIAGKCTQAMMAIIDGALVGDYRWSNPAQDFSWVALDDSVTPMDAQTVMRFGDALAAHKEGHIFSASGLKNAVTMPDDFSDDLHWPAVAVVL